MSNMLQFNKLSIIRRKPGVYEFNQILELVSEPALLVDAKSGKILLANSKVNDLTDISQEKLIQVNLDEIIRPVQPISNRNIEPIEQDQFILKQQDGSELPIQVNFIDISDQFTWQILTLRVVDEPDEQDVFSINSSLLWKSHQKLNEAINHSDLAEALNLVLQAGQELTNTDALAIYQAAGQNLELHCQASIGEKMPQRLSPQDLIHLRSPRMWTSELKPQSDLHRLVLEAGYNYIITVPIGHPNATIGLLAVGDKRPPSGTGHMNIIQILTGIITTIIQHHTLISNLKQRIEIQTRFRKYVEAAEIAIQDCIIALSEDLRIIQLNRSAELALGYSSEEARDYSVEDILIGTETLIPQLKIALEGIPTINQENIRLYRRSGEAFLARVSTLPVKVEQDVEGVIILVQDLSEQESIQSQAEQLEQRALLGEVMAIFAHEVRNPINNLSTGLQLMAYNLPPGDPNQEIIARLKNDCDRLEAHMKAVLTFSRTADYEMESVDIGILINRLLERLRPRITKANVKPHVHISEATPAVIGNPRALEQVFSNLITNAVQAMEDQGGTLALKIQPGDIYGENQYVSISVADSGPGIPKENLERVFQPFFTTKSNGTGLGLAITKRIITAHKGNVGVKSFPGGTVFTVQLPSMISPDRIAQTI
jgi:PAS domain S-box-containing protein